MSTSGSNSGSRDDAPPRGATAGRRPGRNTTFAVEAYSDEGDDLAPHDLMDPESTGARVDPNIDGYHQPTAMFDQGQFLGELADLEESAKDTRAKVEAEAAPPKGFKLIIVDGPDLGMEWAFKVPEVTLGRDEDCELMMSDIAVSRRHAQIALEGDEFVLRDLDSGNGTLLNGARTTSEVLAAGDEITIGERTFRFVELAEAPPTAAAHPVAAGAPAEPLVGDLGEPEGEFAPLGNASQVDVGAARSEPSVAAADPAEAGAPTGPRRGEALRKVALFIGLGVLVVGILAIIGLVSAFAVGLSYIPDILTGIWGALVRMKDGAIELFQFYVSAIVRMFELGAEKIGALMDRVTGFFRELPGGFDFGGDLSASLLGSIAPGAATAGLLPGASSKTVVAGNGDKYITIDARGRDPEEVKEEYNEGFFDIDKDFLDNFFDDEQGL